MFLLPRKLHFLYVSETFNNKFLFAANSMSSSASDRPQYPRTQYNIQRPPHMDPSSSQQNIHNGSLIHSPENPYAYDVVPTNYR
jgi:hypothetical protein